MLLLVVVLVYAAASIRAGHWKNCLPVRMISLAWFNHLLINNLIPLCLVCLQKISSLLAANKTPACDQNLWEVPYKFPVKQQQKQVMYNDPFKEHKISNIILGCKLHSKNSRTKQLTSVKLEFTLFWMCLSASLGTLFLTAGTSFLNGTAGPILY